MRELIDLNQAKDRDQFIMIRGYPRKVEYIRELEQRYSAKLIPDIQAGLIQLLDHHIIVAKQTTGQWPEYIAMEREPMTWFIPVPYCVECFGLELMIFQKPAWFFAPRKIGVPVQSWRK